ncbi:MAG: PAS domain S-box protein [Deltaproteobacteria bacterium]|nr:PAS domain S-box protein [Deltaproteobacteria bacterium]
MEKIIEESNIAIVGGGMVCKAILQIIFSDNFKGQRPNILGVADKDDSAEGLRYAREKGIYTTNNYKELFEFKNLDLIMELTKDEKFRETIKKTKPPGVSLIDHFEAVSVWNFFQIEEAKTKFIRRLHNSKDDFEKIVALFKGYSDHFERIITERSNYSQKIRRELVESQRAMAQIIQGSTVPTFVINKDHIVTHWNKACEKLTGLSADEIVGTNKQWKPFRSGERPTMADVILDEMKVEDIKRYYGAKWGKSDLLEGAYEAEEFFPNLGENGKWLFFTAAPIKGPDGKLVGAIETLWDKTEEKRAVHSRERHNRELSALCSIYTALSSSLSLEERLNEAFYEIVDYLLVGGVSVFLLEPDGNIFLKYSFGIGKDLYVDDSRDSVVHKVFRTGEPAVFEGITEHDKGEIGLFAKEGIKSLVYVPIRAKEKSAYGVLRVVSRRLRRFDPEERDILELIGSRMGAALENSMLNEQCRRSEEKYRSLFNNDPHPIFILNKQTFEILNINKRAEEGYGYSRDDFLGMNFLDLEDGRNEEIPNAVKNLSKDKSKLFLKKRHLKKGGIPFFVNINICNAEYAGGHVLLATTTDISESIEKEAQLIQASKMTTLGTMAAGMAHEINQPLNVIQVCADFFLKMIKKGMPVKDEDLKSMASDISSNVQRASEIIKHMRDFARQSEVVKTKVNINDPIKDVFKVLGHQLKVHQIELELDLDPELPCIMADHNRLEQVFINLVTNAVDAMDKKGDELGDMDWKRLLKIKSFSENGQAVVTVTDTGTGIPKEIIDKIFEPFFTTKEVGKGTGLGVSISYGIVKDYNGAIEIKSEVGKGTTFELRFPVSE